MIPHTLFKKHETSKQTGDADGTEQATRAFASTTFAGLEAPYRGLSQLVVCSLIPNFRFITCSQFSKARLPPDDQECRALPQLSSHLLLFIFTTHFIKQKRRIDSKKERERTEPIDRTRDHHSESPKVQGRAGAGAADGTLKRRGRLLLAVGPGKRISALSSKVGSPIV